MIMNEIAVLYSSNPRKEKNENLYAPKKEGNMIMAINKVRRLLENSTSEGLVLPSPIILMLATSNLNLPK